MGLQFLCPQLPNVGTNIQTLWLTHRHLVAYTLHRHFVTYTYSATYTYRHLATYTCVQTLSNIPHWALQRCCAGTGSCFAALECAWLGEWWWVWVEQRQSVVQWGTGLSGLPPQDSTAVCPTRAGSQLWFSVSVVLSPAIESQQMKQDVNEWRHLSPTSRKMSTCWQGLICLNGQVSNLTLFVVSQQTGNSMMKQGQQTEQHLSSSREQTTCWNLLLNEQSHLTITLRLQLQI